MQPHDMGCATGTKAGSRMLDRILDKRCELAILEPSVFPAFQISKRPLRVMLLTSMHPPNSIVEILDSKVLHGLARENTAHLVLDPLLIGLGRSRMPSVQTIELNTANIATTAFKELVIRFADFVKGTQAPGISLANEPENAAKIIRKNYAPEPRTIDEARRLENFLVLSGELRLTLQIVQ